MSADVFVQSNNSSRASEPALASRATKLTACCCQFASTGCASHRENLSCCLSWSRLLPQSKEPTAKCFQGLLRCFFRNSHDPRTPPYQHSLSELIFQLSNFAQRAFFSFFGFGCNFSISKNNYPTLSIFHFSTSNKKKNASPRAPNLTLQSPERWRASGRKRWLGA